MEPASPRPAPDAELSLRDPATGRPLRVLITRPADQAQATAELVQQAGGEALVHPCLVAAEAQPPLSQILAATLQQVQDASLGAPILAVTSRYAVQALGAALSASQPAQPPSQALRGFQLAAVGPRTAQALIELGCHPDFVAGDAAGPDGGEEQSSAAQLAAQLIAAQPLSSTGPRPAVLFLRAAEARPTLPQALRAAGFSVTEAEAYRMQPASPASLSPLRQALTEARVDLVPFGSPRTVAITLEALGSQAAALLAPTRVGAIGQTTAQALLAAGIRVDAVASQARFSALLATLARMCTRLAVLA